MTGFGQDVRQGKGAGSCNYRGSLSGGWDLPLAVGDLVLIFVNLGKIKTVGLAATSVTFG